MIRNYFLLFTLLTLCTGCGSAVPFATTYSWDTQHKMQAARHWEILADDLAGQVRKYVLKRKDLKQIPIHVASRDGSPFEEIFSGLLISELIDHGLTVSRTPEGALEMEYSATLLEHSDRYYQKIPMKFSVLGTGVIVARNLKNVDAWMDRTRTRDLLGIGAAAGVLSDVAMSHSAGGPSHNEVIITTSLSHNDALCLHKSDIYYINDPDADQYIGPGEKAEQEGRTFNVVN